MIYCINPDCERRQNPDNCQRCQACNNDLLIQGRYRLIKPLRELHSSTYIEVFEVNDHRNKQTKPSFFAGLKAVKIAFTRLSALLRGSPAQALYSPPKVLKVFKAIDNKKYAKLFKQEARILTDLRHPGIPKAEPDDDFRWRLRNNRELSCLVMEKIQGQNLEQWLRQNRQISEDNLALDWLKQIVEILDYVHKNDLFHRDIKPSNIMRKPDGSLVLIDFGTAREVTQTVIDGRDVTEVRSYGYTAPEQLEGRAVPQSDFFALGRTFVHLLTGSHPTSDRFSVDSQTRQLIWRDHARHVSQELADFIDQLMAPSVQDRFGDTLSILQRLEEIRGLLPPVDDPTEPPVPPPDYQPEPLPPRQPPIFNRLGIIFGFFIVLLVGVWFGQNIDKQSSSPSVPLQDPCKSSPYGISDIGFSSDGKYLAIASLDKTVRVREVQATKIINEKAGGCQQHEEGVVSLKINPNGRKKEIATAGLDAVTRLWTIKENGKISLNKKYPSHIRNEEVPPYKPPIVALDFNQNGDFLATASADGIVKVWDTKNNKNAVTPFYYGKYIRAISLSRDGNNLAIAGLDNKAQVWQWKLNKKTPIEQNDVVDVAFHPINDKFLAVASANGLVKVWEQDTNKFKQKNFLTYPMDISFSPDGKNLVILGLEDRNAYLWEWENDSENEKTLYHDSSENVVAVAFNPKAKPTDKIATASQNGTVRLWNVNGGLSSQCSTSINNLVAIAFHPKSTNFLATSGAEGKIDLIDIKNRCQ